jgi:hypothetical protein
VAKRQTSKTKAASELLDLVVARAPELAAAGVASVTIEGFSLMLRPRRLAPPGSPTDEDEEEAVEPSTPSDVDPLSDPATFAGGRVPGYPRPRKDDP